MNLKYYKERLLARFGFNVELIRMILEKVEKTQILAMRGNNKNSISWISNSKECLRVNNKVLWYITLINKFIRRLAVLY